MTLPKSRPVREITLLAKILEKLEEMHEFHKTSREEDKRERKAWEDRLSLHKEDMEKWAKNNVENFVTGLKSGLREGGVTDIADEVRRKKKEEDEWRNRIGAGPRP